ncbi:Rpn family recombination-promoting nuclease/putative transposase [Okeania sp.]|uniref:Rpn family recombination-promoting nuclease/putative transposase n=1 Tax=Okeania sp. TaxID=3100323 RepID=UPI002B4AB6C4|nr:Rpn family recombination-promoting nuclease/putative transposase [Okeania sp.]MEB3339908.1 Rpn family recombination-promoting nuclease/putative transposase [Okeania sp.]
MKFISPKVDYAFKKIFGSNQSQQILISFLNAIIYDGKKIIQSLTINNPYNPSQIESLKDTYLDIRATLSDNSIVIIEMQVSPMQAFDKRVSYNLCKTYANQLEKGELYFLLNPVIAVTITDFKMFDVDKLPKAINKFVFKEEVENVAYINNDLKLIFVELPKFQKKLEQLESLIDKWIFFLKETASLNIIPEPLGEVPEIERALNIANQANFSKEELEEYDRRAMMFQDERGKINYAKEEGRAEGKTELVMLLVNQRFGEVDRDISDRLSNLKGENLESLVKAIFDFNSLADLLSWLDNLSIMDNG